MRGRFFTPAMPLRTPLLLAAALALTMALSACKGQDAQQATAASAPPSANADYAPTLKHQPTAAQLTTMGRQLFFDRTLSASGQMSCATCHDPGHAFGPAGKQDVQMGGADGKLAGTRAVPSLRYLQTVPPFSEHFFDNDGNDSEDAGPTGGRTWDGRARSAHEQARLPLLARNEMANASPADVADKIMHGPNAALFKQTFGDDIFDNKDNAFRWATMALEVFQESPADFYPYTSKYDAFLRNQVKLSAQEMHGLQLFNADDKGNCASCHISQPTADGAFPQFSDFGLIALGVPRNGKLPANADKNYFDLGLCGPERTDLKDHKEYCGLFRTPSLRNVALRQTFFHNGSFHSLEDVVRFYATRDTNPERWYPKDAHGKVIKYDDLPQPYQANVNNEAPFGRKPGDRPALTEAEIRDVVAFMKTLTDGYKVEPSKQQTAQR
ncbi:cytochrome c peroxidase [Andreprevotia lacus DSM 23236]|jgi:cytochrome c peroxidase|uniref:Cytochrome c peroxidase n=1 Tax=Andreprevotia lacus DSM 23236 TaxID=1121001 RepID=A0A1W1X1E6_9NEIS|nr:cytochrome c peroxidase [Andreprevotia lacus]SMC17724.1 cytochrome c peroxidase [Andreprevotia lacus DSM 23236]